MKLNKQSHNLRKLYNDKCVKYLTSPLFAPEFRFARVALSFLYKLSSSFRFQRESTTNICRQILGAP